MPSVEMRRTTRVFGMGKGVDGARVLRSGRRLWPEQSTVRIDDDDWLKLIKKSDEAAKGWRPVAPLDDKPPRRGGGVVDQLNMFGLVYTRKKRKRKWKSSANVPGDGDDDRMYGKRFVRKKTGTTLLAIAFQSSWAARHLAAPFLYSILVYMTRASLGFYHLSQFIQSEPICSVFASSGIIINLSRVPSCTFTTGICKFFKGNEFMPFFSVDFSAVPLCFVYMNSKVHFRYFCQTFPPVNYLNDGDVDHVVANQYGDDSGEDCMVVDHTHKPLHPILKVPKLGCRSTMYRNGLILRGGIQKRRSSLRRRRSRNPSLVAFPKPNGALFSELMNIRKNGFARKSGSTCFARNLKAESSSVEELMHDLDSACCFANLLVSDSDKCYREIGASIMLETSSSGEWLLVVKKDGLTRLTHKAEKDKVIRPGSNRFTHDIIWSADSDSLKLEFPNRSDWIIFKELYKECSDRNSSIEFHPEPASDRATVKSIPVPGVREVAGYADSHSTQFLMPESYISVKEDEVSRLFAKKTANYDMDLEDEEWLRRFNCDFASHDEVSEDTFESMVDAFEKAYYCKTFDLSDEKAAANLFVDMGKREVVEAVCSYWMKKRPKKTSLLRVFQEHQGKRSSLHSKVMRKRRSFKRQPSKFGRGKQPNLLQAMAAEQDALQEQIAMLKVEEAKAAADRSVDLAIRKRQRAQVLMQNADLATFKAAMAFRIAEAAQVLGSPDAAAVYVLD